MNSRLSIVIVVFALCLFSLRTPVFAQTDKDTTGLPLTCDREKGVYKETTNLVIVPLTDVIKRNPGDVAIDTARNLFYEFAYVRGNSVSPINAVMIDGKLLYLSCEFPDYTTNIVSGGQKGNFILAVVGSINRSEVQEIINKYKITTLTEASLVPIAEVKTTVALANEKSCGNICQGLVVNTEGIAKRQLDVEIGEPSYAKSIRQKEQLSVSFIIKNNGEFPLYGIGTAPITLQTANQGISPLYNASWLSPTVVSKLTAIVLPGAETTFSITLSSPLVPGKYAETLYLKAGSVALGKPLAISFTVENDNYKLAKIVSKDGTPYANLRETPSLKGIVASKLDVGTYVIVKGYQDAWVQVETKEGSLGWVYKPFIREL